MTHFNQAHLRLPAASALPIVATRTFPARRVCLGGVLACLLLLAPALVAQLPPGTVAYYPFDGTATDASGYGNHLKLATGTLQYTNTGGKFGGALYLDGNTTLGTVSGLFPTGVPTGSSAYTVACFIKADTGGSANGGWIGYGLNGGTGLANNFRLNGGYTGVWNYWWNRDLGATVPNSGDLRTAWHSVVGTWDGATRKIYIDGLLQASDTPAAPSFGTNSFVVGKTLNDANFKGWVDELLIANRAFSLSDVQAYNNFGGAGVSGTLTTLVSALNPSTNGDSVTFTATVLQTNGILASAAGGSVVCRDSGTPLGTNAVSGGTASFTTAGLATGTHTITAAYGGDGHYLPSVSTNLSQVVLAGPTNVVITAQPQNLALPLGQAGVFSVTAKGTPPLLYQWYHGTSQIAGATNATLPVSVTGSADTGNYWVFVNNSFSSATSSNATLTLVSDLLAYESFDYAGSSNLGGQAGGAGWSGAWTNVNGTGAAVVSGSLGAGANAPSGYDARSAGNSSLVSATSRCGRRLDCSASGGFGLSGFLDANGHIGADGKTVYVGFLQQPSDVVSGYEFELHRGDLGEAGRIAGIGNAFNSTTVNLRAPNATQTPLAWGSTNVSLYVLRIDFKSGNDDVYVYRNPTGYSEADNEPTLTMLAVGDMSFDGLALSASNSLSVAHDEIRLGASWGAVLGGPPMFIIQPTNQDACTGQAVLFDALAESAQSVSYQWFRGGSPFAGQTNATLSLAAVGPSDVGAYWVVASNALGVVTSSVASLTVQPMRVSLPNQGLTVASGGTLAISASVESAAPLSFQWFKDGAPLAGQTSSSFTKPDAGVFDAGQYVLVASNLYGSSTSAVMVVSADLGGLLAYDGFDYPSGDLIGQNGGTGWSGAWQNIGGGDASVVPGSMVAGTNGPSTYDPHSVGDFAYQANGSRSGRFLDCSASGPFAAHGLIDANGNIGADGTTLYLSFMQQPNGTTSFYEFELHRSSLGDPGRIGGVGNDMGSATTVNLRTGGAQTPIGPGSTNVSFYVLRVDYHNGNDDVRVYMNPTALTEPATPTLTMLGAGDMSFNGISFGAYLNDRAVQQDEVRLGLSWGDVIGNSLSALRMAAHSNNQFTVLLAGSPFHTYQLQAARVVTGPWTNLATMVAPVAGVGQFVETNMPDAQRFYRSLAQPTVTGSNTVLADFEGATYGAWVATGTAFGSGPAQGTLPSQNTVSGYQGIGLVNSFHNLDAATGTLTSPPFTISAHYINFLIGGGNHPGQTCLNLLVNGVVVRTATGANSDALAPVQWDVSAYLGQMAVLQVVDSATGSWGHILVDEIVLSDQPFASTTTVTTRTILVTNVYLNMPVKTGSPMRQLTLSVGGQTVRQFDIELADAQPDFWVFLDLTPYLGQTAVISVNQLPSGSGALLAVNQANTITGATNLYEETLRPQFHFSSRRGWNNDANGMVWNQGEFHLYYQHNPYGWNWGDMYWGHAVSSNMVQWTELPIGIYPRQYGDWVWSGSAVVDANNTSGFQSGPEPPMVAAYTSTGRGECIAYSNDRGRTFTDYTGDPVVVNNGRDPHLLWYAPSNDWVMAVYDATYGTDGIAFYTSPNLKQWTYQSRIDGFFECPDLFQLPVDGQTNNLKWVLSDGSSGYMLGQFNGAAFTAETAKLPGNSGSAFYAAQTFSRMPPGDARCVRIGWAEISMPGMPFNQMMYFPTELTLRTLTSGVQLCYQPVAEITNLYANQYAWTNLTLSAGSNPLSGIRGTLFDLKTQFAPGSAQTVAFSFQGVTVTYDCIAQTVACNGLANSLAPVNGVVQLDILVDRDSVEIFGNNGQLYMPLPASNPASTALVSLTCAGGTATFNSLVVSQLKSAWLRP